MDYSKLVVILIKAVQELSARVEELDTQIGNFEVTDSGISED